MTVEERNTLSADLEELLNKSLARAEGMSPERWHSHIIEADDMRPLQVQYGVEVPHEWSPDKIWRSPKSLRSVDSQCALHIRNKTIQND
jgi:hypothetical protein